MYNDDEDDKDDQDMKDAEDHPDLVPDERGQAKWRMELSTVPDIGVAQSQIMDTGMRI